MATAFVIAHSLAVLDQLLPILRGAAWVAGLATLLFLFRPLLRGLLKAAWLVVRPRRSRPGASRQVLHIAK